MAVKSSSSESKLTLDIDNGDLSKLTEVMDKWKFKDHQSMLRFAISIMLLTEDKKLWMQSKGEQTQIVPADDLVRS